MREPKVIPAPSLLGAVPGLVSLSLAVGCLDGVSRTNFLNCELFMTPSKGKLPKDLLHKSPVLSALIWCRLEISTVALQPSLPCLRLTHPFSAHRWQAGLPRVKTVQYQ